MTKKQLQRVRELAGRFRWRKVKSEHYRNAPHEYVSLSDGRRSFGALARQIRRHGQSRPWRDYRYRYLIVGRFAYWWLGPVINRTYRQALDNGGWPRKRDRKRIKRRFWGGE